MHCTKDGRKGETGGTNEAEFVRKRQVLDAMEAVLDEMREDCL
jgi:hypothetical protein